jgi:divalent metal cation (Fe/Co/Zn/Cd) transporter
MRLLRDLRGYFATGAFMGVFGVFTRMDGGPIEMLLGAVLFALICGLAGAFGGLILIASQRADTWSDAKKAKAWRNVCCTATAVASVAAGYAVLFATGNHIAAGLAVLIVLALVAAIGSAVRATLHQHLSRQPSRERELQHEAWPWISDSDP